MDSDSATQKEQEMVTDLETLPGSGSVKEQEKALETQADSDSGLGNSSDDLDCI
jgi:hypothetical protein